ncbi:hypothetical protein K474DRAFT_1602419 [Panus rudis PR-1116 ss-1]|nr:hypothetical protein K474DRAFT_1602419 [Panus rudis PR-1116 ss-1]
MFKGGLFPLLGLNTPFDQDNRFVSSPVFPPPVLAALRLIVAFYALFVVLFAIIWESVRLHDVDSFFSFFTELSYIGLLAYFWASGVQTLVYALRGRRSYPLQQWPQFLQFLHSLLYSTITTYPIVVTIAFWTLLSSADTFATTFNSWHNVSVHAMNSGLALFEIIFTNVGPLPWIHLLFCEIFLACYLGVAYITRATQGIYPYDFLNPHLQHAKLAAYIVGIGVGEAIVFTLVRYAIVLRVHLTSRSVRQPAEPEAIDDWEEIHRPSSRMSMV